MTNKFDKEIASVHQLAATIVDRMDELLSEYESGFIYDTRQLVQLLTDANDVTAHLVEVTNDTFEAAALCCASTAIVHIINNSEYLDNDTIDHNLLMIRRVMDHCL